MDSGRLIEKEALFVGSVKALSTDTDVKKLFDRYVPTESKERNIQLLGNSSEVKKSHLESAMKVLSLLAEDYPEPVRKLQSSKSSTKLLMGTEIVTFIRAARLSSCRKCSSEYSPYHSDNTGSKLSCYVCVTPCHRDCFNDDITDDETGIVFLCSSCLDRLRPNSLLPPPKVDTPAQPVTDQSPLPKAPEEKPPAQKSAGSSKDKEEAAEDTGQKKGPLRYDRTTPVCPQLLVGACTHGISGKDCPHYHPRGVLGTRRTAPRRSTDAGTRLTSVISFTPSFARMLLFLELVSINPANKFMSLVQLNPLRISKRRNPKRPERRMIQPRRRVQLHGKDRLVRAPTGRTATESQSTSPRPRARKKRRIFRSASSK